VLSVQENTKRSQRRTFLRIRAKNLIFIDNVLHFYNTAITIHKNIF